MNIQTRRDLGRTWLLAGMIFASSVAVVRLLGRNPNIRTASLWIGYVGLAALGAALFLTAYWVDRSGPPSHLARAALHALIAVALVLWLLAVVFPFL